MHCQSVQHRVNPIRVLLGFVPMARHEKSHTIHLTANNLPLLTNPKDHTMTSRTIDTVSYIFMYVSITLSASLIARAVALNLFA